MNQINCKISETNTATSVTTPIMVLILPVFAELLTASSRSFLCTIPIIHFTMAEISGCWFKRTLIVGQYFGRKVNDPL